MFVWILKNEKLRAKSVKRQQKLCKLLLAAVMGVMSFRLLGGRLAEEEKGQEGCEWCHSNTPPAQPCQKKLLGFWRGGLAPEPNRISAKCHFSPGRSSCRPDFTAAWSQMTNQTLEVDREWLEKGRRGPVSVVFTPHVNVSKNMWRRTSLNASQQF